MCVSCVLSLRVCWAYVCPLAIQSLEKKLRVLYLLVAFHNTLVPGFSHRPWYARIVMTSPRP